MSRARFAAASLALVLAAACSEDILLPAPGPVFDPAALRLGDPLYACGNWGPSGPPGGRVLVDLHLAYSDIGEAESPPRPGVLDTLRQLGAEMVYEFAFPAVRAWVAPGRLQALVDSAPVAFVISVPNTARFDWQFIVGVKREPTPDDSMHFVHLGGQYVGFFGPPYALVVDLPDQALPYLRRWSNVRYTDPDGFVCLGSSAGRGTLR